MQARTEGNEPQNGHAHAWPSSTRYEPRGEIARGGMGVVSRVWDPHLRRQLAMKVILPRCESDDPRALARFLEEAQVTSQLDHPGIVPVHDVGIDADGRAWFTMRLVRGRDFRQILELVRERKDGWTLARALGVMLKVCEAVAYAHSKGVIHRDLKPANVMVGRFGEVYVMDWGLARLLDRDDGDSTTIRRIASPVSPLLTLEGRIVGTPSYMPLEQARGRRGELGPRSDVYAIGAMLYHLLTGQMPYAANGTDATPLIVRDQLLAGPPAPVRELAPHAPEELAAICQKAMARDPLDRYATPLEIAADVEAFLGRRPVAAHAPSLAYVARLFFERNRTLALTVTAASVALAVAAFVGWDQHLKKVQERDLRELSQARTLAASSESLFPAVPERLPEFDRWLADAGALLRRAPHFRERLATAQLEGRVGEVALLEPALADMTLLERELAPTIASWRARAAELERASLDVEDRAWRDAIAGIAKLPAYGGLALSKQLGLVPLRRDPASELWEFWHVLSGERPVVDREDPSRYALTEQTGIVLVLIPGTQMELGYPDEETLPNTSSSLHDVALKPAFVGKYEVTQAQWLRAMNANPSLYQDGIVLEVDPATQRPRRVSSLLHPVESVNWIDCARFVRRLDLELPSEELWEVAARGRAEGVFWWDDERREQDGPITLGVTDLALFEGRENIADDCALKLMGLGVVAWSDGWPFHAPVGRFGANGFGLYDVLGNVSEWCAEEGDVHVKVVRRVVRGANWFTTVPALFALSTRGWDGEPVEQSVRGLRVARAVR